LATELFWLGLLGWMPGASAAAPGSHTRVAGLGARWRGADAHELRNEVAEELNLI